MSECMECGKASGPGECQNCGRTSGVPGSTILARGHYDEAEVADEARRLRCDGYRYDGDEDVWIGWWTS